MKIDEGIEIGPMVANIRREVAEANTAVRKVLLGDRFAEICGCSQSNISQAEKAGSGEILKVVNVLLAVRSAEDFGVSRRLIDDALRKTVSLINKAAGYKSFPANLFDPANKIGSLLDAVSKINSKSSNITSILNKVATQPKSDKTNDSKISKKEIDTACDSLIEILLAVKNFVQDQDVNR